MNKWHDWIDWIGGYPYEYATVESILEFFSKDGFEMTFLESRATGIGCNEFVFTRKAGLGVLIDNPLRKSRFLLRRFGIKIAAPDLRGEGYVVDIPDNLRDWSPNDLVLFRDGEMIGVGQPGSEPATMIVAPSDWPPEKVTGGRFEVVRGRVVDLPTIWPSEGHMFYAGVAGYGHLADDVSKTHDDSPASLFEDTKQLQYPHSLHDEIVKYGEGRFSHWGEWVLFSSSDNSDPRSNGRSYRLVIAEAPN